MLDVTILKVTHGSTHLNAKQKQAEEKAEAMKLIPYIERADVVGLERGGATLEDAVAFEINWRDVGLKMGRTQFEQQVRLTQSIYSANELLTCFKNRMPIYYLERFSEEESKELSKIHKEFLRIDALAASSLMASDFEGAYNHLKVSTHLGSQFTDARDIEMAKNLKNCEEYVRSFYPALKYFPRIRLVAAVGAMHQPEKYYPGDCTVVDLVSKNDLLQETLVNISNGASSEDVKPLLIAHGQEKGWIK